MKNSTLDAPNFLKSIIEKDLESGRVKPPVVTRFPPEPNGYLHIGHAKSICLNFGLALEFGGRCHLRFDDTNPETEDVEYVESIKADVKWLGFDWKEHLYFASDYFQQLYDWAVHLIKNNKAYVCSLDEETLRKYRGDFNKPGQDSPYRNRSVTENLDLFERMKKGEFEEGTHVLRAKIDMKSPNMNMRDPLLYRIRKARHHRTHDQWCIYPMYDYAHPLSDAIELVTHSICTLEFQDHRPFYDWCIENLPVPAQPKQYEFARMNMTYLVMSKRKLLQLVKEKRVLGWDDPRMPTISGIRRLGYTSLSLQKFANRIGVAKANSVIEYDVLEDSVREHMDEIAIRSMAVLDPLLITITNWEKGKVQNIETSRHPKKPELGKRIMPFTRQLWIERNDFMENPTSDFYRLSPGGQVRLRNAYVLTCKEIIKDSSGNITELRCEYDSASFGGKPTLEGKKPKGIIHWVSAEDYYECEVRIYKRLFKVADPENVPEGESFLTNLNPDSLKIIPQAKLEKSLKDAQLQERYQFERLGYFCLDSKDSKNDRLVFNMTVSLQGPGN
jgi:glutaminyl-tRNA synthetase